MARLKLGLLKTMNMRNWIAAALGCMLVSGAWAQQESPQRVNTNAFRQLGQELPTPNVYRTAYGAPGHEYWQQKADYDMRIHLDDATQRIDGSETITYTNNSPDNLRYVWLQLDQNVRALDSDSYKIKESTLGGKMSFDDLRGLEPTFDGGFNIQKVVDASGKALDYTTNKTMMRIDLPRVLRPGNTFKFSIDWWYNINDRMKDGGRSGFEYFEEEDNYIYTIAQFYPRMVVYCDNEGWQNKQFLGNGEFTLNFGDYHVELTVPEDHIVGRASFIWLSKQNEEQHGESKIRWDRMMTTVK